MADDPLSLNHHQRRNTAVGELRKLSNRNYQHDARLGVWTTPDHQQFAYSDGQEVEQRLLKIIESAGDVSCASDELVAAICDWPTEYHLSPTRHNLFRGFEFQPGQSVLEIGAGCGAVTRYLGEQGLEVTAVEGSLQRARICAARSRGLDRVSVYHDNFAGFETDQRFDVVMLIGVLEYASIFVNAEKPVQVMLDRCRQFLNDKGVLVVAIENRLGLKYFNGCSEDHTNRLFDSINDLYVPGGAQTFGRVELSERLQASGFTRQEFVYPFPDYKLPKALLRHHALGDNRFDAGGLVGEYLARDYIYPRQQFFSERLAWPVLAKNRLLADLSNSFLVVSQLHDSSHNLLQDSWLAKTFSSDRYSAYRQQNTLSSSRKSALVVKKDPLHDTAPRTGPLQLRDVHQEDYIQGRLYSQRLQKLTFQENAYSQYLEYLQAYLSFLQPNLEAGDILAGRFFDCIPVNLIEAEDGSLASFDLEWVYHEPVTLDYLLYRAVLHDLSRVGFYGAFNLFDGHNTLRSFLYAVFRDMGRPMQDADCQRYVEQERAVLDQIVVAGDKANLLYRLDEDPRLIFKKVTDLHQNRSGQGSTPLHGDDPSALAALRLERDEILSSTSFRLSRRLAAFFAFAKGKTGRG